MLVAPDRFSEVSLYELLRAAERGVVAVDHRFLHAIVDRDSIEDVVRFGIEEATYLRGDLVLICRHLRTPQALPLLIEEVRRDPNDIRLELVETFIEVGKAAVEPLLALHEEIGGSEDSDVGFLLGSLGVRDDRIYNLLVQRLEIDAVDAAQSLEVYGDPAAIPALEMALNRESEEWRRVAIRHAIDRLREPPPPEPDEPFDLWEHYPEEEDPDLSALSTEELFEYLDCSGEQYRYLAVEELCREVLQGARLDRIREAARHDASARVRALCWEQMADVIDRPEIRHELRMVLEDATRPVVERAGALVAFSLHEGSDPQVRSLILDFYERPETRARALKAMTAVVDERYLPYFPLHLNDPDVEVRTQAVLAVGCAGMEEAAKDLVPLFEDDEVREIAIASYALAAPAKPSRAGMLDLLQRIERLAVGLSEVDEMAAKDAINLRLEREDREPMFDEHGQMIEIEPRP